MKVLELSDKVSLVQNGLDTATNQIIRTGIINDTGIVLEYLDELGHRILVTCTVDGAKTCLLFDAEDRLAVGDSRSTMKMNGLEFLFEDTESSKLSDWKFVKELNDDDNETKYQIRNEFIESYSESPIRNLLSPKNLEAKLVLYYPVEGKTENVDGIAVLEIGNDLRNNAGVVTYYNFREILELDIKYL
jgi:hypothetical protein